MVLIYVTDITPRVSYVMDLIFNNVLGLDYELTINETYFKNYLQPKIAYTSNPRLADVWIDTNKLLFENTISDTGIFADKNYADFPKFFASTSNDFLGYDIFSMVFYFVTNYEEYFSLDQDIHKRFKAENSTAFKYKCLEKPFLNYAITHFSDRLNQKFPELKFKKRKFNYISTIDIDNAFAYAHKGFKRNIGGLFRDVFSLNANNIVKRLASNINELKDPYNTFTYINSISEVTHTQLQYFVLIGDYASYDKNPDYRSKGFRKLLKSLSNSYKLGLHPSYESFNDFDKIYIEKKRLEDIVEKKVTSARCHFLRINLPETYRTFINSGITDDYSMIYASQSGFRTGLCIPYKWFDLENNQSTNLMIHPSVIMEGTLRDYNKLNSNDANTFALNLLDEVKKYGGEFISIFHNDTFVPEKKEWIDMYEKLLTNSKKV